jgi:hypothetical protein
MATTPCGFTESYERLNSYIVVWISRKHYGIVEFQRSLDSMMAKVAVENWELIYHSCTIIRPVLRSNFFFWLKKKLLYILLLARAKSISTSLLAVRRLLAPFSKHFAVYAILLACGQ